MVALFLKKLHFNKEMHISSSKFMKLKFNEQHYYLFLSFKLQFEATHHLNILEEEYFLKNY